MTAWGIIYWYALRCVQAKRTAVYADLCVRLTRLTGRPWHPRSRTLHLMLGEVAAELHRLGKPPAVAVFVNGDLRRAGAGYFDLPGTAPSGTSAQMRAGWRADLDRVFAEKDWPTVAVFDAAFQPRDQTFYGDPAELSA